MDSANEYYLCYRPRALTRPRLLRRPRDPRFYVRILQEPLNRRLFRSLDVFHATFQRLPQYHGMAPFLGTLHDIFYLSQPQMGSPHTRARAQARYRDVANRSRLIMTLSEFSKNEIVHLLGVRPDRVRVVPLAASPGYAPQEDAAVARVRARYGLTRPYILFGGGFGRRKNVLGALRAFGRAIPRLPPGTCLAISGGGGPLKAEAHALIAAMGLTERIALPGFVPDADYPALMSGCVLFFFPTILEGFGLPALEAMASGAPVVTSATTSLPEVCGDAAVLVDPADDAALAEALATVACDPALQHRLRDRGLNRAAAFSWRRTTTSILQLYDEARRR